MKARPLIMRGDAYEECNIIEAKFVEIRVPGNNVRRIIPVILHPPGPEEVGPVWVWYGDTEYPTITPDIDTTTPKTGRCHLTVAKGKAIFYHDSQHENAGKTLDLLNIDD